MSEAIAAGLDELLGWLGSAGVECRPLDDALGRGFEVRVAGGSAIVIRERAGALVVEFGGWHEVFELDAPRFEPGEAEALVLDFVAAALFGELKIEVTERGDEVLGRSLWVRVEGSWRLYARRGRHWSLRRTSSRGLANAVPRPRSLLDRGPRGQPHAPWAGAGGFDWAMPNPDATSMVIDGELDLHDFPPREVAALVREYLAQCEARGIRDLRIVHGKGIGALRRTVHAILAEHPAVERWRLGGQGEGSWGATIVRLRASGRAR